MEGNQEEEEEEEEAVSHVPSHTPANTPAKGGLCLPEIWEDIIPLSGNSEIYCLRQTCRIFLRLSNELLDFNQSKHWCPEKPIRPSPNATNLMLPTEEVKAVVRRALSPSLFCDACLAFRQTDGYNLARKALREMIWCSGCLAKHPTIFFSPIQRVTPDDQRVCIGLEGSVSVCRHQQIEWQLFDTADELQEQQSQTCRNPGHLLFRQFKAATQLQRLDLQPNLNVGVSQETGNEEYRVVKFSWKVLAFKHSLETELTFNDLREKLRQLSKQVQLNFCPHLSLLDDGLLRPFDPTYCACTAYGIPTYHDGDVCKRKGRATVCCLCQSPKHSTTGKFLPVNDNSHQISPHSASCSDCDLEYKWTRRGDQVFLSVNMNTVIDAADPTSPNWIGMLDSSSIRLREDAAAKYVTWCDDDQCASSYRRRMHGRLAAKFRGELQGKLRKQKEGEEGAAHEKWMQEPDWFHVWRQRARDILDLRAAEGIPDDGSTTSDAAT